MPWDDLESEIAAEFKRLGSCQQTAGPEIQQRRSSRIVVNVCEACGRHTAPRARFCDECRPTPKTPARHSYTLRSGRQRRRCTWLRKK